MVGCLLRFSENFREPCDIVLDSKDWDVLIFRQHTEVKTMTYATSDNVTYNFFVDTLRTRMTKIHIKAHFVALLSTNKSKYLLSWIKRLNWANFPAPLPISSKLWLPGIKLSRGRPKIAVEIFKAPQASVWLIRMNYPCEVIRVSSSDHVRHLKSAVRFS